MKNFTKISIQTIYMWSGVTAFIFEDHHFLNRNNKQPHVSKHSNVLSKLNFVEFQQHTKQM